MKRICSAAAAAVSVLGPALSAFAGAYSFTNTTTVTLSSGSVPATATYTSYSYSNHGTIAVLGSATIGTTTQSIPWYYQDSSAGPFQFYNGGNSSYGDGSSTYSGANLNIGTAQQNATLTIADVDSVVNNYAGNTINVASGSTLALLTDAVGDTITPQSHSSSLNIDGGNVNLGGTIQFQPSSSNYNEYIYVQNSATFVVTSNSSTLQRVPGAVVYAAGYNASDPSFVNNTGAILSGAGMLTYQNSTGISSMNGTAMIDYGTIAPGTSSSPGTLTLNNYDLDFGSELPGGTLAIRLGGMGNGQYDVLDLTGTGGFIGFDYNSSIAISLVNGFTPQYGDTWTIMNYEGASGTPSIPSNYILTFYPTYATLEYVPEPASAGLMGIGALALFLRRRRITPAPRLHSRRWGRRW